MESIQTFNALVRQKIVEHEFHPICIEATMKLVNARNYEKNYEKTEKARAKHEPTPEEIEELKARQRKYSHDWYLRHKAECKERSREWARNNREKSRKQSQNYYWSHKEERNAASKKWRDEHKEIYNARMRAYKKRQKEQKQAQKP